ncbi:Octanoyltransferase LipM [Rubrobacter xylanophilus DSM 9941]|uniref:lipoate--protein ligase family protein n=1 Tax=Rubrobacter xylanophilus TaxID=49319 RepID=UPI001C642D7B|nr:biotin/lipoate A/B protein ligase family protein [Rubrobacter xylanophilus]QYJ16689.1 Octanoyltransferase LipM [Rubrobacter xylanophilus DSM 9941]
MTAERWSGYRWCLIRGEPVAPPVNHALDEVLTRRVGAGERPPTLRFWERLSPEVALGRFQSLGNEVDAEGARRHGVTVVRRMTGGGAMFIEPANVITYSLYAPAELVAGMSAAESYPFLDAWVVEALRSLGIEAYHEPINDISSPGGKIGGSAQARAFGAVLHHTTLAYDMDAAKMLEVLRIGQEKLSDKAVRSAERRVGPLRRQTRLPRERIVERMVSVFSRYAGGTLQEDAVSPQEAREAEELVRTKYGAREWSALIP